MPGRVPQRTCLGCRSVRSKKEMIRIVRTPQGSCEVDFTGKKPGRGAYICPSAPCLELAWKGKRLEKALGVNVPDDVYRILKDKIQELNREDAGNDVRR